MNVYFISGLGADERAFSKIRLPSAYRIIHLPWIKNHQNESLASYSARMAEAIDASHPFILLGLSFGGMLAVEIAEIKHPLKTILLSSACSSQELPGYFRRIGKLNLHKLIPGKLMKWPNPLTYYAFGCRTKEEKKLLGSILKESDPVHLEWAVDKIFKWERRTCLKNIFHIHGTADRILPIRYVKADVSVKDGRHFMVLSEAGQINRILENILSTLSRTLA